jgi:hypothetical protein
MEQEHQEGSLAKALALVILATVVATYFLLFWGETEGPFYSPSEPRVGLIVACLALGLIAGLAFLRVSSLRKYSSRRVLVGQWCIICGMSLVLGVWSYLS